MSLTPEFRIPFFLILVLYLVGFSESIKLCLLRQKKSLQIKIGQSRYYEPHQQQAKQKTLNIDISNNDVLGQFQENLDNFNPAATSKDLRSYKPHYLHSFSYPQPITPLIYYGQVKQRKPIFLFKEIDSNINTVEQAETLFSINGYASSSAGSFKQFLLRRQPQNINRFMLVVQVQNLYLDRQIDSSVEVYQNQEFYLFVVNFGEQFKVYQLIFSNTLLESSSKIIKVSSLFKDKGIKLNFVNSSTKSNHDTWKLAEKLRWSGINSAQISTVQRVKPYPGICLQIEFEKIQIRDKTQIHLKEIFRKRKSQSKQQMIQRVVNAQSISNQTLPKTQILKNYQCGQAAINKLFEGLSYEYGTLQLRNGSLRLNNNPKQLLSFSPSRKRFPWGFLWDDGFHCQVAVRKDQQLALKVVKSWLDTIQFNGWIPRQQNRGQQREYLCSCPRFMDKDIRDGNPPTLILPLQYMLRKGRLNQKNFPETYWNKLKLWHSWFIQTLEQDKIKGGNLFKWKDSISNADSSFTSGMDDFPRPLKSKGHVDLQSWMYFFTNFMDNFQQMYVKKKENSKSAYSERASKIKDKILEFHDKSDNVLKDFDQFHNFSKSLGYPSILPIAFGMVEQHSAVFNGTIEFIKKKLDTGFGLSSISMTDRMYLQNQNAYWRGPVWINLNYLLLRGLKMYYPSQISFYKKLRSQLLNTVCGNYKEKGYFFQNYIEGKGSFSYPFNGWTSLISIVENQNY